MELLRRLRGESMKRVRVSSILLMVVAVAVFLLFQCQNLLLTFSPRPLAELSRDELEGAFVDETIHKIYAQFVEEEQYRNNVATGVITGAQFVIDLNATDYIAMFVHGNSNVKEAAQMLEDSVAYYADGSSSKRPEMRVRGAIRAMDSQEEYYYRQLVPEIILQTGMSAEEVYEVMPAYIIDVGRLGGNGIMGASPIAAVWAAFAASVALLAWGIIRLVKAGSGAYQEPLRQKLAGMGEMEVMLERLDTFYNSTAPVSGVRLGSEYVLFQQGAKTILLRPWEVAWAYQKTTVHRRNGIKTGTNYAVLLRTMDGKQYAVDTTEEGARQLLEAIHDQLPGTVLGYSKELEASYKKDRAAFRQRWEEAVPGCTNRA